MKSNRKRHRAWMASLGLAITLMLGIYTSVRAQDAKTLQTVLQADVPLRVAPGDAYAFDAHLTTAAGEPLPAETIDLYLDDVFEVRGTTREDGRARLRVREPLDGGVHQLRFVYDGSPQYAAATTSAVFEIAPVELVVETTPPLAGVEFTLNDVPFRSAADGIARITVDRAGEYLAVVLPYQSSDPELEATFKRWEPDYFARERSIHIQEATRLVVGYEIRRLVRFAFVDHDSSPVDPHRISSLAIRSSSGTTFTYEDGQPRWLEANRIVRRLRGLEAVDLVYSVQSVLVDGSNVVNQGQQSFQVIPGETWPIELLLYSARFTTRDALFGFPMGSGISLEYPDGQVREIPFGSGREIAVESLARGVYHARVADAPGISISTPIVLSRNQDVTLLAISYPTLIIAVLLPVVIAAQLWLIGRPRLFFTAYARLSSRFTSRRKRDNV